MSSFVGITRSCVCWAPKNQILSLFSLTSKFYAPTCYKDPTPNLRIPKAKGNLNSHNLKHTQSAPNESTHKGDTESLRRTADLSLSSYSYSIT